MVNFAGFGFDVEKFGEKLAEDRLPEQVPEHFASGLRSWSSIEAMRKRLRELDGPIWGTKAQLWLRLSELETKEAKYQEKLALDDVRRQELSGAQGPVVARRLKGPRTPTESE